MRSLEVKAFRQREKQVPRPCGRKELDRFEDHQESQCGGAE